MRRPQKPELYGLVDAVYAYAENGVALDASTEPASLTVPLIINFGGPYRIGLSHRPTQADRYASFAAGLHAGPVIIDSDGNSSCVQVNFTPLGGRLFFGLPMGDLTDRMVPVADLGDRQLSELARRLDELDDWDSRLDMVQTFVADRLRRARSIDPAVRWAYASLASAEGQIRIGVLAKKLDRSRRRLVERFRHDIGLPPKTIGRIMRLGAAVRRAEAAENPDWADIAFECGYADQSHLTREFAELAGSTPSVWRAAA